MIWRKSPMDKKTFTTMALRVGRYLAEADAGRLRLDDWVLAEDGEYPARDRIGGRHHMGGTRMAASPRDGVVDKDCRVFGTANLFIAGSSVFPNAGQSNPTLTIVQLALRLADFPERATAAGRGRSAHARALVRSVRISALAHRTSGRRPGPAGRYWIDAASVARTAARAQRRRDDTFDASARCRTPSPTGAPPNSAMASSRQSHM
jgi:GMC oxidoreductase